MNGPRTHHPDVREVALDAIKLNQRAQPRDHLNLDKTAEYAEAMAAGDAFPPLVVFFDGADYWLADGFHRHYAARGAERAAFPCEIHRGGLREAILYSVGANATHGYQRTNADKRRAVITLASDPLVMIDPDTGAPWSDREIARRCHVGHPLVARVRSEVTPPVTGTDSSERTYTTKHGTTTTMRTGGINRNRQKATADAQSNSAPTPTPPPSHSPNNMDDETRALFDADNANSFIANRLWDIARAVTEVLPAPEDAAARFPTRLLHTFSATQAREIRDWFDAFANTFETREIINVAAE